MWVLRLSLWNGVGQWGIGVGTIFAVIVVVAPLCLRLCNVWICLSAERFNYRTAEEIRVAKFGWYWVDFQLKHLRWSIDFARSRSHLQALRNMPAFYNYWIFMSHWTGHKRRIFCRRFVQAFGTAKIWLYYCALFIIFRQFVKLVVKVSGSAKRILQQFFWHHMHPMSGRRESRLGRLQNAFKFLGAFFCSFFRSWNIKLECWHNMSRHLLANFVATGSVVLDQTDGRVVQSWFTELKKNAIIGSNAARGAKFSVIFMDTLVGYGNKISYSKKIRISIISYLKEQQVTMGEI